MNAALPSPQQTAAVMAPAMFSAAAPAPTFFLAKKYVLPRVTRYGGSAGSAESRQVAQPTKAVNGTGTTAESNGVPSDAGATSATTSAT
jgi:hypothetical protein